MRSRPLVTFDHGIFVAQRVGGVSRYFVNLARHLSLAGVPVGIHSPLYVTDGVRTLARDGVDVTGFHSPVFRGVTLLGNALATCWPFGVRGSILHETWYGPRERRRDGQVIAVTLHDMISELFPERVKGANVQSRRKRQAVDRADLILCVSETTRCDAVREWGLSSKPMVVTPLASSLSVLPRRPTAKPFVLYVGQRGGYKNFALLLEAFRRNRRLTESFSLVCFGGGAFSQDEQARIPPGVDVRQMEGDDVLLSSCYASARLFVSTSLYEGFGLPLLEAMAAGCPALAVRAGAVPEVGGAAVEYVDGSDADALSEAMDRVLHDDAALRLATEKGYIRSRDFSWQRTAHETRAAYAALLSGG